MLNLCSSFKRNVDHLKFVWPFNIYCQVKLSVLFWVSIYTHEGLKVQSSSKDLKFVFLEKEKEKSKSWKFCKF